MSRSSRLAPLLLLLACTSELPEAEQSLGITSIEQSSGTTALLVGLSPVDEHVVWASGSEGTWLRTTDGGKTWQAGRVPGGERLQFRDVHGVDANTAFLLSVGPSDSSRIYVTRDGGASWTTQFVNPDPRAFYDCMDFWDADRGLAVSDAVDGRMVIQSTSDGGAHWQRIPPDSIPAALPGEASFATSGTCLVTRPGGKAWIGTSTPRARLFHTDDYGAHWSVDTIPLASIGSISFRDDQHGILFSGDSGAATARTSNGGKSWARRARPPFGEGIYGGTYIPGAATPTIVAAGPKGLAFSTDEGAKWTVINFSNYWSVRFVSPQAGWAVGANGRITKLAVILYTPSRAEP